MTNGQLNRNLADELRTHSPHDFKVALALVVLTAFGSVLFTAYTFGYSGGMETSDALYSKVTASHVNFPTLLNIIRVNVTTAIVVSALCLCLRKSVGFFLSILALLWIGVVYVWWYLDSLAFLRNAEVSDFSELPDVQHMWMFRGANWWDIMMVVIATILLAWQVKTLVMARTRQG